MPNETEISDGMVRIRYQGAQTTDTISDLIEQMHSVIPQLRRDGQPVWLLVDVSELDDLTAGARLKAVSFVKGTDYDRIATFGGSMNNLMMKAIGRRDKLAYFDTEEEAVKWLKR